MTTPVLKLYEIGAQYDEIAEAIVANGGELTEELSMALGDIEDAFEEKAERVALYIRNCLATKEGYALEAKRLSERAGALKNTADSLKQYLKINMERLDLPKIKGNLVTVAIQKSPPSVKTTLDQDGLARSNPIFVKTSYAVHRDNVLAAHKKGQPLPPGMTVEQSTHLRIR